ncbi:peroxiredoxin (alkyl hydroperoxide reductase subunit C) [Polynucleobacter meluiroseus]|uniref:Glutathione-dependent peroxiredoxin n=1 Tax=Polynucleobacter meluiroseus TaxID=1938814 RepID=A0A240E381_9BURK|nr:peroxiredoxin [Polynucleobacter meluiroseus]SNX28971.1 peroxiredoxin (alkyl hydroperoxide reductase subunit C) [Polynucleobacter meluiroseus]
MIAVGQKLPNATLYEYMDEASAGCSIGPNPLEVENATAGKKIIVFAVPGAFTPTCSEKHVPGYIEHFDAIKAKGVDEIWCISVNDPFVMGAWGRDLQVGKKVRMLGDGSADFTKKLGMEFDLTTRRLGIRSQRYAMIVEDGIVKALDLDAPGKFEVSDAASILKQL